MNTCRASIGIDLAYITEHLGPVLHLFTIVKWETFGLIVGKVRFARDAPDYRRSAVACDEIAPVLFCFIHAHPWNEITPGADQAGSDPGVHQVCDANVCLIKVLRANRPVIGCPRETGFVSSTWIKRWHVG